MLNPTLLNFIGAVLANFGGRFVLPEAESNHAGYYDPTFDFINIVTVIFFVAIIVVMVWFVWKYRRTAANDRADDVAAHNTGLELAWSLPPLVIVVFMFYFGFSGYMKMSTVPADAYQIDVTGQKWNWTFTHPNGYSSANLDVPADKPVVLHMHSNDVIHSLYIPVFRVKKDVVPGRYSTLWFIADEPTPEADAPLLEGADLDKLARENVAAEIVAELRKQNPQSDPTAGEQEINTRLAALKPEKKQQYAMEHQQRIAAENGFQLYCAEFCGTSHSLMLAKVIVHEPGWRAPKPVRGTPWQEGRKLFVNNCSSCHALDAGGPTTGPSFANGVIGQTRNWADGTSATADEQYLHDSIVNPKAKVVAGYQPVMPLFNFEPQQVNDLVTFLKSPHKEPE